MIRLWQIFIENVQLRWAERRWRRELARADRQTDVVVEIRRSWRVW